MLILETPWSKEDMQTLTMNIAHQTRALLHCHTGSMCLQLLRKCLAVKKNVLLVAWFKQCFL